VAVTYSRTGNLIAIYIDSKVAATSTDALTDAIATVRIGGPRNRNQWRRYVGKIDEPAVWNNALSADDVKTSFGSGPHGCGMPPTPIPPTGRSWGPRT